MSKDFYCNRKFWWLTLDLDKHYLQSCCSADPIKADISFLQKNPGQSFNSPEFVKERQEMLAGKPASTCATNCWKVEAAGLPSKRLLTNGKEVTHLDINAQAEVLHVIVSNHCNLSCIYCCPRWSSTWARDIDLNGTYDIQGHQNTYSLSNKDKVLLKLSQKDLAGSSSKSVLQREFELLVKNDVVRLVDIQGGEPFLYLSLAELVNSAPDSVPVIIYTGLGVDPIRFRRELDKIKHRKDLTIGVSAESVTEWYERIRFGNTWSRFSQNLAILDEYKVNVVFSATLTNLSLFGLKNFLQYASSRNTPVKFNVCTDPIFLSPHVIDRTTKDEISEWTDAPTALLEALSVEPTEKQRQDCYSFLTEFNKRRNLTNDIFPDRFINWLSA